MNVGIIEAQMDGTLASALPRTLVCNSNTNSNIANNDITVNAELQTEDGALFARARTGCSESSGTPSPILMIGPTSPFPQRAPVARDGDEECDEQSRSSPSLQQPEDHGCSSSSGKAFSPIRSATSSPSASAYDASPPNGAHPKEVHSPAAQNQGEVVDMPLLHCEMTPVHAGHGAEEEEEEEEEEEDVGDDRTSNTIQLCQWDGCNRMFADLQGLVTHLDREHTLTMVRYTCEWKGCSRRMKPFDARYKLVTHLRCHTGEKPYKCSMGTCGRSFSRLENLKLHIRTHTGEKPYVCHYDDCHKRFNNTSDRAKHMKTHITRKPYMCKHPGCGRSYTDPSSMRKHIKFAHKMKDEVGLTNGVGGAESKDGRYLSNSSLMEPHYIPSPKRPNIEPLISMGQTGSGLKRLPPPSSGLASPSATVLSPAATALFSLPLFQLPGQGTGGMVRQPGDGGGGTLLMQNGGPSHPHQPHPQPLMLFVSGGNPGVAGHEQFIYASHQHHHQPHGNLSNTTVAQADNGKGLVPPHGSNGSGEVSTRKVARQRLGSSTSTPTPPLPEFRSNQSPVSTVGTSPIPTCTTSTVPVQVSQLPNMIQPSFGSQNHMAVSQSAIMGLIPTYMRLAPVLPSPLQLTSFVQTHPKPMSMMSSSQHLGLGTSPVHASVGTGSHVAQYIVPHFMVSGVAQSQPVVLSMVPVMSHQIPHTEGTSHS